MRVALLLAALGFSGLFAFLVLQRVGHPFEFEWMEGGSLEHLHRVLRGQPLYVAPSIEFAPYPYPPLYYYAGALWSKWVGESFAALRWVSLLSSCGSAALLALFVTREGGRPWQGLLCAGLFLASFRASGAFMDLARVDSLFLALVLGSAFLLRFAQSPVRIAGAGFCAFLAIMTKQTGLVFLAPLGLWCIWRDWHSAGLELRRWRFAPIFAAVSLGLVGAATLYVEGVQGHPFLLHIVEVQQHHEVTLHRLGFFLRNDLAATVPVLVLLCGLYLYRAARTPDEGRVFYALLLLGGIVSCMIPRIKVGGALNNLIPPYALLSLVGVLCCREIAAGGAAAARGRAVGAMRWVPALLLAALLGQFGLLAYGPKALLPRASDLTAGRKLVDILSEFDGEVLVSGPGYLARRAGKSVFAHQHTVRDFERSGLPGADALRDSYRQAIAAQRFDAILESTLPFLTRYPDAEILERHYRPVGRVFGDPSALVPSSGTPVGPGILWIPNDGRLYRGR